MPLKQGKSKEDIAANISTEISAGKNPSQAAAIAYSVAGKDAQPKAAGILYLNGRQVLLMKRADTSDHGGTWALPGGHIEAGETPEQAARRESGEETGHTPSSDIKLIHDSGDYHTFECADSFTPTLNNEHTEFSWANADNLPSPLYPAVAEMMSKIFAQSQGMDKKQSARTKDANGWIEIKGNPISKPGVFEFSGKSIKFAIEPGSYDPKTRTGKVVELPDHNTMFNVYRPEEELNNPQTIDSFKLLPLINDHPTTLLGQAAKDMVTVDRKPAEGVLGEEVYYDEYLRGNIKMWTDRIMDYIHDGKVQLSVGYRSVYEKVSGVFNGKPYQYVQRNILGNHVALVKQGRMGAEIAVLDESESDFNHFVMSFDAQEIIQQSQKEIDMATLEELSAKVDKLVEAVAKLTEAEAKEAQAGMDAAKTKAEKEAADKVTAEAAAKKKEGEGMDSSEIEKRFAALESENAKLKEQLAAQGSGFDAKEVFAAQAKRDLRVKLASKIIGNFDVGSMDAQEVDVYVADKLGIKVDKPEHAGMLVDAYLKDRPTDRAAVKLNTGGHDASDKAMTDTVDKAFSRKGE